VRSCLIDGEAVACDENGLAVFERLRRKPSGRHVFLFPYLPHNPALLYYPVVRDPGSWGIGCNSINNITLLSGATARRAQKPCPKPMNLRRTPRRKSMLKIDKARIGTVLLTVGILGCTCGPTAAAVRIEGQVQAGGSPLANSTVTLWAASAGEPRQLAQTRADSEGRFQLGSSETVETGVVLYVVAKGGEAQVNKGSGENPAVALLSVLGNTPPSMVVVNEMTTVASVWTNAQFLDGPAIKGHALGIKIAAGNVPNFVDLQTGGWGSTIQDPLNSGQTPTMANFATLADLLAGCATRVKPDACSKLFAAATPPTGKTPTDTLTAAEAIVRYPWYQPERLFLLLDDFYPVPAGKNMRAVPFMPYLNFPPSAWVFPLKFDGGGFRAGGKAMFDSEGNLWVGDNFTVGWQAHDTLWQGNATKFAPNGRPLSPMTTGFAGGGMQGGTFGNAIDANATKVRNRTMSRNIV
jgi:hypothetical protein